MSVIPAQASSEPRDNERLFFYALIFTTLAFAAGFCLILFVLYTQGGGAAAADNPLPPLILPEASRQLVDFSLTDRTGRTVTRSELDGKYLVVDFLFTSCSVTCPTVNRHMAQIQQLAADEPDVRLVSLTVDPRDDTPAVLAGYGQRFGADTNRWLLLTGNKAGIYYLIKTSFLSQDLDDPFTYMPGNFSHTERIAIVDPHGQVRAYFDGTKDGVESAVLEEIKDLRK